MIQDFGTDPVLRPLKAWRLSDSELVYSGMYRGFSPPIIADNIIEVVYHFCERSIELGFLTDEEIILYARNFKEKEIPQELLDKVTPHLSLMLIIRCSIDLDTGERRILRGEWIITH